MKYCSRHGSQQNFVPEPGAQHCPLAIDKQGSCCADKQCVYFCPQAWNAAEAATTLLTKD
jgi:hypothetical protein